MAARGEAHALHQPFRTFADVAEPIDRSPERIFVAERPQRGAAQILLDRHLGKDVGDLKAARQAAPIDLERGEPGDRLAVQAHFARARPDAAADEVEQRRFAGAVRPDDRVPLALGDVERDAADDLHRAEALAKIEERKRRVHPSPRKCRRALTAPQASPTLGQSLKTRAVPTANSATATIQGGGVEASTSKPKRRIADPSLRASASCRLASSMIMIAPDAARGQRRPDRGVGRREPPCAAAAQSPKMQHRPSDDALGREHHDGDEHQAEIELPGAGDVREHDLQEGDDHGADDRPGERADAADIGHQENEARLLRAELLGVHDLETDRREPARDPGEERRETEGDQAHHARRVADEFDPLGILAHRVAHAPERRAGQRIHRDARKRSTRPR